MPRLIFIFVALCFFQNCFAQFGTTQKVTHSAFKTDGFKKVRFNVAPELVEIRSTRSTRVLVETSIRMDIDSKPLLEYAIESGRYDFEEEEQGDVLLITPVPRKRVIMIGGRAIVETIKYIVYIPERLNQVNKTQDLVSKVAPEEKKEQVKIIDK